MFRLHVLVLPFLLLLYLHLFENYKKKTKGSASRLSMSQAFGIEFFVYLTPKTILENKL